MASEFWNLNLEGRKKIYEELCEEYRAAKKGIWYHAILTTILFILLAGYLYLTVFWLTPSWIIEKPIPFYYQEWFLWVYSSIAMIYVIIYLFIGYRWYRGYRKKMEKYKPYEILMQQEEERK